MVMDRTDKEIIIRLPLNYSQNEAQEVIDYFMFTSIKSNKEIFEEDVEELNNEIDAKILEKLNSTNNLKGVLSHYANPELRKLEKKAWENEVAREWK